MKSQFWQIGIEANIKALWPRSSWSSTLISQTCAYTSHDYKPGSKLPEYQHAYMNIDSCKDLFLVKIQILKYSNTWPLFNMVFDPEYYLISELFLNNNSSSSYLPKFGEICFFNQKLHNASLLDWLSPENSNINN